MPRISVNTTGLEPVVLISLTNDFTQPGSLIDILQITSLTINNNTGVHSYVTFSDTDTRKLTTPADNSVEMEVVIDSDNYFGVSSAPAGSAQRIGIKNISQTKTPFYFRVFYAGDSGPAGTNLYTGGTGFFSALAPTVTPDAPVWTTPLTIEVDGAYTDGAA